MRIHQCRETVAAHPVCGRSRGLVPGASATAQCDAEAREGEKLISYAESIIQRKRVSLIGQPAHRCHSQAPGGWNDATF
ncbi:MAG: hypothetical protein LZF62_230117 [Nitrospira sp.]|nr:MAG: hypothetical protein LZF62_230117 [Nitrospira sp.]